MVRHRRNICNKFLQKIWNLNHLILKRKEKKNNDKVLEDFNFKVENHVSKIDKAINNFQLNVAIAQFYELYKHFYETTNLEISNEILKKPNKIYAFNDTIYSSFGIE